MDASASARATVEFAKFGMAADTFMRQSSLAICLADPRAPDTPIVFANDAFLRLTGYGLDEVMGRNCRFLQGAGTDPIDVHWVKRALQDEDVCVVELLNYRKDGTPFWNALHIGPVFDERGELLYYFGSQWDVTSRIRAQERASRSGRLVRDLRGRIRDLVAATRAIVQAMRSSDDTDMVLERTRRRLDTLAAVGERTTAESGPTRTRLRALAESVFDGLELSTRIELDGDDIRIPSRLLAPVGLALHEFGLALAASDDDATARFAWAETNDRLVMTWQTDGPSHWESGAAFDMLSALLRSTDGTMFGRDDGAAVIELPTR